MTADRLLVVLMALCCVAALGLSATTLRSSVSTKPDDVIHVQYSDLPIGRSQVNSLKNRVQDTAGSGAKSTSTASDQGAPANPQSASGTAQSRGSQSGSNGRTTQAPATTSGQGQHGAGGTPSLLDRLLALLAALVRLALVLLAILLPLALAYYYRDRLRAALASLFGAGSTASRASGDAGDEGPQAAYGVGPTNVVYRTWLGMVRRAGVDPASKTPGDCARAAIDRGLDPAAVRTLTREFEAVRYGEAPVTAEREARVRETRSRLDLDWEGERA